MSEQQIYKSINPFRSINIYHKGCGTMGVPVFASENIELTFAFNFKTYINIEKFGATKFRTNNFGEIIFGQKERYFGQKGSHNSAIFKIFRLYLKI